MKTVSSRPALPDLHHELDAGPVVALGGDPAARTRGARAPGCRPRSAGGWAARRARCAAPRRRCGPACPSGPGPTAGRVPPRWPRPGRPRRAPGPRPAPPRRAAPRTIAPAAASAPADASVFRTGCAGSLRGLRPATAKPQLLARRRARRQPAAATHGRGRRRANVAPPRDARRRSGRRAHGPPAAAADRRGRSWRGRPSCCWSRPPSPWPTSGPGRTGRWRACVTPQGLVLAAPDPPDLLPAALSLLHRRACTRSPTRWRP